MSISHIQKQLGGFAACEFQPFPGLWNNHLMTVVTSFLPRGQSLLEIPFERDLIQVDFHSQVLLESYFNRNNTSCLVIVHGLEGSGSSRYVLGLSEIAILNGFNVVRVNLRNCGDTLHLTPTLYNGGQSGDLIEIVKWLEAEKKQQEQYLIGFSLGGNLVLKTLGEMGSGFSSVKGGCTISPSIDLAASVECLKQGFNKIYDYSFLRSLRKKIIQKCKLFPQRYDFKKWAKVNSLLAFDNTYTAPDAGYSSAYEYYEAASSCKSLNEIKKPTLIITAQDDPIVPYKSFAKIDNSFVHLLSPKHGGHMAFLANGKNYPIKNKTGRKDYFWADGQILSFCREVSSVQSNTVRI